MAGASAEGSILRSRRARARRDSLFLLGALATISGPVSAQESLAELRLDAQSETAATESGRWSASPTASYFEQAFTASALGADLADIGFEPEARTIGLPPVRPLLASKSDLRSLLLGNWSREDSDALERRTRQVMQVIPEIPDIFADTRKEIPDACKKSAGEYLDLIKRLAGSNNVLTDASSPEAWKRSAAYDRDCLTPLAAVPQAIREVTGILITSQSVPFCSATAVGKSKVITAKHCFFSPGTGEASPQFQQLQAGQISFRALAPHHGLSTFTVRPDKGAAANGAFGPARDLVLLEVASGALQRFARVSPSPRSPAAAPLPTWVVGVNALVGDVRSAQPATSFVRGSSPKACSIVQIPSTGCLVHSCQTAPATSGAGVIELGANGPTLVGVHVTSGAESAACGVPVPVGGTLNLAAAVTSSFLTP